MWDLWWTKWHWNRFFPEYFVFPLSDIKVDMLGNFSKKYRTLVARSQKVCIRLEEAVNN
jgi:hypothetical protein